MIALIKLFIGIFFSFLLILSQHPDLTVTSEEKVVNAILMWGLEANELCDWEAVDELMLHSTPELLFGDRLDSVYDFFSFVRFPVMPIAMLNKVP